MRSHLMGGVRKSEPVRREEPAQKFVESTDEGGNSSVVHVGQNRRQRRAEEAFRRTQLKRLKKAIANVQMKASKLSPTPDSLAHLAPQAPDLVPDDKPSV